MLHWVDNNGVEKENAQLKKRLKELEAKLGISTDNNNNSDSHKFSQVVLYIFLQGPNTLTD